MYRLPLALLMLVGLLSAFRTQPLQTAEPTEKFLQPKAAYRVAEPEPEYHTERIFIKFFLEVI